MPLSRLKPSVVCVLLALGAGETAAAPGWDCQRGEDGKEWVCVSGKGKLPPRPAQEERAEKPVQQEVQPEPRREIAKPAPPVERPLPVERARPIPPVEQPNPIETSRPIPEAVEPRPAPIEAAQPAPSVEPTEPPPEPVQAAPVMPPPKPVESARPAPTPEPAFQRKATPPSVAAVRPSGTEVKLVQPGPHKDEPGESAPTEVSEKAQPSGHAVAQAPVKTGWNCRSGGGKEWDCALIGPDPRGEAHVVAEPGEASVNWAQSANMTREDEQRFSGILTRMPANPWALSCGRNKREWTLASDFLLTETDRILREKSPIEIHSDRAELIKGEASNYEGSAELARADQRLYADFITHNKESGVLNAQGGVVYREKGLSFASDTAFMQLGSDQGILRNSQFILETVPARGTARVAHIDSKTKSRYETATYTTCQPNNQDWLLHATNATIDKDSGQGTATNAWLEFKGVPFLYTPYMSFPVDDRRRSGLLSPYFGYSQQNGFDFTLPYYLNLAPNYDLTLMPRELSKRGPMLRSDFRYLTETSKGRLFVDILPWDLIREETRGQIGWQDTSRFTDHISSHVDLHLVSDKRYIYELGNLLAINTSSFLRSWGEVNYGGGEFLGGSYSANVLVDYYQSLDQTITDYNYPYRRMPQINFSYGRDIGGTGIIFQSNIEAARFDQNVKVNGERLNLRPRIYYPFRDSAGYITPSLALQHTEYWLHNLGAGEASSFSRTAPIFSVDSGATFEREFNLFDSPMQQTLEPRLFYLWVPKVNQPYNYNFGPVVVGDPASVTGVRVVNEYQGLNFDSAEYDFNFYQLFRENRFSGTDRLSDANNITPALTTRLIEQDSGLERLKFSVGKVFYLKDPQVVLNPYYAPQTQIKNNIVAEASSMLSEHWSLRSLEQWNPSENQNDRTQVVLQYNDYANTLFNVSYRYRRDPYAGSVPPYIFDPYNPRTVNQTDVSARVPIGAGWFGIGRWQYDLLNQVTVQAMAGVEKETCCWRFTVVGLRYINGVLGLNNGSTIVPSNNTPTNNAVFFQFELKGLGRFGDQMDNFLLQNFSGYRTDYDSPGLYP